MVWPFSRRRKPPGGEVPLQRGLEAADLEVLNRLVQWIEEEASDYQAEVVGQAVHVHASGRSGQAPLVVAQARKGKLVRLEVREQTPRELVDDIVRTFEKEGLWSFNGVVRTVGE